MKEEILDITKKLYHNHLTPETATNLLLRLFGVSGSPSFEDWLNKYFETPKMKMMYKRKDGKGEYDRQKLIRDYKRAFRQSQDYL